MNLTILSGDYDICVTLNDGKASDYYRQFINNYVHDFDDTSATITVPLHVFRVLNLKARHLKLPVIPGKKFQEARQKSYS